MIDDSPGEFNFDEVVEPEIQDIGELRLRTRNDLRVEDEDRTTLGSKLLIFKNLKAMYPDMEINYFIEKFNLTGHLEYSYVSDFADPVRKINVEFPNTYWHNGGMLPDTSRNNKLQQDGWKVIEIASKAPSVEEVVSELKSLST